MNSNSLEFNKDYFRILDKFLVDNTELEELSAKLSIFNIFGVLRVEDTEIRHSNVLAWLLDPQGSHGLRYNGDSHDFMRFFSFEVRSALDSCNQY